MIRRSVLLAFVALAAACTMQKTQEPPLTGPSEYGQSINVAITPDSIQQDGVSQSRVDVTVLGVRGEPLADVVMRAEIRVDNISTDFGTLSKRDLRTNASGTATLFYTAPATPSGLEIDTQTVVQIAITPVGTDLGNQTTRFGSLRLLPPGRISSPNSLSIAFDPTGTTTSTAVDIAATFRVVPPAGVTVVRYFWDFGDGSTATTSLPSTSHNYEEPGSYFATVTVEDIIGRTGSATVGVTVAGPPIPTADFSISPGSPAPGQTVRFNGALSRPSPGRTIVSYEWDFGNGSTGTGIVATTSYSAQGVYQVSLKVTDDRGRTHVVSKPVTVAPPPTLSGR